MSRRKLAKHGQQPGIIGAVGEIDHDRENEVALIDRVKDRDRADHFILDQCCAPFRPGWGAGFRPISGSPRRARAS